MKLLHTILVAAIGQASAFTISTKHAIHKTTHAASKVETTSPYFAEVDKTSEESTNEGSQSADTIPFYPPFAEISSAQKESQAPESTSNDTELSSPDVEVSTPAPDINSGFSEFIASPVKEDVEKKSETVESGVLGGAPTHSRERINSRSTLPTPAKKAAEKKSETIEVGVLGGATKQSREPINSNYMEKPKSLRRKDASKRVDAGTSNMKNPLWSRSPILRDSK